MQNVVTFKLYVLHKPVPSTFSSFRVTVAAELTHTLFKCPPSPFPPPSLFSTLALLFVFNHNNFHSPSSSPTQFNLSSLSWASIHLIVFFLHAPKPKCRLDQFQVSSHFQNSTYLYSFSVFPYQYSWYLQPFFSLPTLLDLRAHNPTIFVPSTPTSASAIRTTVPVASLLAINRAYSHAKSDITVIATVHSIIIRRRSPPILH